MLLRRRNLFSLWSSLTAIGAASSIVMTVTGSPEAGAVTGGVLTFLQSDCR